ncbi:thioredoxin [Alteromonas aestuariivivens]|uniref:Thioredoxin n=1 Tax=Alteromonas aestuariivivens TaxID=1938339 RepID=A0A3D8MAX9_9ALTE|nr:thioredoxin [Alteromonas aestuariivivens]RDV26642.1 thioredoxin [Alteromonas aestuariivivens]
MDNLVANNTVDITLENFQQVILQDSREKLIMVDFWAEWCEPCKDLMPILDKIAAEYSDSLILAKVDCDQQQEVAAQFGIRNLPTVMLVKDGQPIDGFAGVQPESQIREMLAKYLPKPEDEFLVKAAELVAQGDYQSAFPLARQAWELNNENLDARYLFIDCLIETGSIAQAKAELESIKLVDQDSRYQSLSGKIELAEQAAESPELKQLQEAVEKQPDDLQLKVELAVQLQQAHKAEQALELLYGVLVKDLNFGEAKKVMLDMINALADGDPLKSQYRRKVYSLLY